VKVPSAYRDIACANFGSRATKYAPLALDESAVPPPSTVPIALHKEAASCEVAKALETAHTDTIKIIWLNA
jgi:hypothetical protein